MAWWLVKTEPDVYSIDDLARDKITAWTGVRNYQARNFLREMKKGEKVLVYHSNAEPSGVVGIATVHREGAPDLTQFDRSSEYFDPKATRENPRWFCPELKFSKKFSGLVSLDALRQNKVLQELLLLRRGSRLSVVPIVERHFEAIVKMGFEA